MGFGPTVLNEGSVRNLRQTKGEGAEKVAKRSALYCSLLSRYIVERTAYI